MRRLLLALLLGLVAAPADAGDLYYTQVVSGDRNVYAVSAAGGIPRIVLNGSEYGGGVVLRPTWRNHVGSNGQAFLHQAIAGSYSDTELLYRDSTSAIVTRKITDLTANTLKPFYGVSLAKDDSFFGVRVTDGQGTSRLYKLHVSVDEVLVPGYIPPATYDDPRMELVYSGYVDPQTGYFKAL